MTGALPNKEFKGWNDFVEFVKVMTLYAKHKGETLATAENDAYYAQLGALYFGDQEWAADGVGSNWLNSYAMAGYVSANIFCQGLARMEGKVLTWDAFINAMEEAPMNVPMGLSVDYANGNRIGIDALAVNKYTVANFGAGEVYRQVTLLGTLEDAING